MSDSLFDQVLDRTGSDSLKWARFKDFSILPMWVADMDFRCAEPIIEALQSRTKHGVFGYSTPSARHHQAAAAWIFAQHGWAIEPDWIVWLPGLVSALNVACRGLIEPSQSVISMTPIYPPFLTSPQYSGRPLVRVPMLNQPDQYAIDFDLFEAAAPPHSLLLLCSPHNPTGRVWTQEELQRLCDICLRKQITICSDEIHCDLVLEPSCRHIPTASLSREIQNQTITLMSASKTFNLPGLNCAMAIIPNETLRRRFKAAAAGIVPHVNTMGLTATLAAFEHGKQWRQDLIGYLRQNRDFLHTQLNRPPLHIHKPQATYLAWIDVRQIQQTNPLEFFKSAGVYLSDGREFDGSGFVRLNYGCPRNLLEEAVKRIQNAIANQ